MKEMPCPELVPMLLRAAEDGLDEIERADLDQHLGECQSCRRGLRDLSFVRAALVARPPLGASPGFRARVRQAVESDRRDPSHFLDYRRWSWRLAPVAAVLVGAIALGLPWAPAADAGDGADPEVLAALPVASALYTGAVTPAALETLLLVGHPDATLGDYVQGTER